MSLAEIFNANLTITPGADGSFIIYTSMRADQRGFTNVGDLLSFLQRAAEARQAPELLSEKQVIPNRTIPRMQEGSASLSGTGHPLDQVKRTSAVGSPADRLAAAESNSAA